MSQRKFQTTEKLTWADVTPKEVWLNRRQLVGGGMGLALSGAALPALSREYPNSKYSTDTMTNTYEEVTSYNNFYEFGTGKEDPKRFAGQMTTDPWSIEIGGLVDRPGTYDLADVMKGADLQQRIYYFRCVEAWSMVIPWVGFELNQLLDRIGVQPSAKYVAFQTLYRPDEMPGTRYPVIEWPYREGLRMDEAMHPLTILATGIFDDPMPNQNGAPIRLVVPWKYGFKSIKSIVKIELTETEPQTSWNMAAPKEYGFYSNVNPKVDHPRWSQATERRVGGGLFSKRIPTRMFNGYEAEVGDLYAGMDLTKNY
ncbi:MAG: protein-methionine-sulfoxide reductase catalytic subunit MsrP [Pseudomonadota bacterium]